MSQNKIYRIILLYFLLLIVITLSVPGRSDDPPKEKSEKDTTKIDIQQMQEVNAAMGKRSLKMDSLIMEIDSLKRKK